MVREGDDAPRARIRSAPLPGRLRGWFRNAPARVRGQSTRGSHICDPSKRNAARPLRGRIHAFRLRSLENFRVRLDNPVFASL